MKNIKYTLIAFALLASSCEKQLVQYPQTTKVADSFYSNQTEMEEAINAVYATLQFTGLYDTALPALGEIPGEDAYDETPANDGGVYGMLDLYNVIAQSGLIADVWQDSYVGIQRANIILNRIGDIQYTDESTKNARIGEMKFVRALLYFNLVRAFGDVPLVVEEVANPQDSFGQSRSPQSEVYAQIRQDLTDAIALLPARNEANKMRVVKTAAQALLAKVALTLGQYAEAEQYLQAVVNSGSHQLLTDPADVFSLSNEMNEEIIFAVQFASGINSNSEGSDAYRMFNPTGRAVGKMTGTKGHGVLKSDFYKLYAENDLRKDVYVGVLESGLAYNNKIAVPTTVVGDSDSDWVVLRYADVLLMLAEVENELGKSDAALTNLNLIRQRAGIGAYAGASTKSAVFEEIDLQRRKELVWEGHRWFDLLRTGRAKSILGISDDNKLLMPLPASQIAADPALVQNSGY
ncbi:RagB/SusD family nutrient uptake outer membrane protein [Marinilongibacter aquaticus]|uniref:RagB/SusD family nutrient uptake outer membrane protein n=1 Tax=Marinilongibacter aquaticus TaxID=2975157 RepID=UPI0021BD57AD|nr:RagB/SusD family nutrient uptake outer membrane protein [Marinilongibacter aquaticus]UBM58623.1 RagB/SusD family nutrient uptake outer membrane protein [Marinilongibacter aquaticus]